MVGFFKQILRRGHPCESDLLKDSSQEENKESRTGQRAKADKQGQRLGGKLVTTWSCIRIWRTNCTPELVSTGSDPLVPHFS